MARTRTRAQIMASARALADQVGTTRNTDAVLAYQINQLIAQLWAKLVAVDPDRFLVAGSISTTAGTKAYALPAAFMSMRRVARVVGSYEYTIEKFGLAEKASGYDYPGFAHADGVRYRVWGQGLDGSAVRINFEPDPGTATYAIYYVQAPQVIDETAGGDASTVDGVAGWERWIELQLAIWMKERDEEDTGSLRADVAQIEKTMMVLASQRDAGKAPRVQNVRRRRRSNWRVAR
jgi:hypothetical protein